MYYALYFTTTANACSVFFYMKSEGAHAHVFYYVFSDFISFGPNLEVYNIIYLALYSL